MNPMSSDMMMNDGRSEANFLNIFLSFFSIDFKKLVKKRLFTYYSLLYYFF